LPVDILALSIHTRAQTHLLWKIS